MTGTDPQRRPHGGAQRRRRIRLPGAAVGLSLGVGLLLAGPGTAPGLSAQEPEEVTIRSGSGWIGVNVRVVTSPDREEDVITFTDVLAGSPGDEAGLEPGDRVLRVNGVPVSAARFRSLTSRLEAGDPLAITVLRQGQEVELSVIAGQRPAPSRIVAVRLQEELDSVRSHFVRILHSPDPPEAGAAAPAVGRFVEAPTIRVEEVGADSIATRIVIEGPSGPVVAFVETPEGVARAAEVKIVAEAAERARIEGLREMDRARAQGLQEVERARVQGLRESERGSESWPARSIEEVRPLSPYLAGLTRVAGAELRTLNPGLAQYFGVEKGLLVTEVAEGTPAAVAGLRGGDVIVASGGREVTSLAQLRESLASPDGRVLEVIRGGERQSITLR